MVFGLSQEGKADLKNTLTWIFACDKN